MKKTISMLLVTALLVSMLAGCGQSADGGETETTNSPETTTASAQTAPEETKPVEETTQAEETAQAQSGYPVTIENNGQSITYTAAPEKVVVLDYISAQLFVALGLGDKVIALAPSMNTIDEVKEEYRSEISAFEMFAEGDMTNGVPSLEAVLSYEPDFVIGTAYAFAESGGVGPAADFLASNANIYATEGTYVENPTLENVYNDILNLGKIFDVNDTAQALVDQLKEKESSIITALSDVEDVAVFNLDTNVGDGTIYTVGGTNLLDYIITLSGGKNIFGDLGTSYSRVSLEEIISRNPEYVIITNYYTETDGQEKLDYMKTTEEFSEISAVVDDNFLILSGMSLRPGIQMLDALEEVAQFLHPEAFE